MRILRHMEEINGRRFAKGGLSSADTTQGEKAIEQLIEQKNKENANDPAKRGLNSDFGMVDAQKRASSMIKTRQRQYDTDVAHAEGARPPTRSLVPDSPLIKNNIYKMDAWLQPFADVKTLH